MRGAFGWRGESEAPGLVVVRSGLDPRRRAGRHQAESVAEDLVERLRDDRLQRILRGLSIRAGRDPVTAAELDLVVGAG